MTGIICMWSGAIVDIPDGWLLCDGTNGTPDLRNRFIVGAGDSYNPGDTGGSLSHDHDIETTSDPNNSSHHHAYAGQTVEAESGAFDYAAIGGAMIKYHLHRHTFEDDTFNESLAHDHDVFGFTELQDTRPKYYALAYIMKT